MQERQEGSRQKYASKKAKYARKQRGTRQEGNLVKEQEQGKVWKKSSLQLNKRHARRLPKNYAKNYEYKVARK